MSSCKLTLIGLYNYDNSIFENLTFPAGVDKDLAVNEILMECGEFEILYSDLDFLKFQITKWGEKHYYTFEKWLTALAAEFNPIHNYDRYEEYTDTHSGSGKQIDSEKRNDVENRSSNHSEDKTSDSTGASFTDTHSTTSDDTKRNVSAYDSSTYQPKEQEKTDGKTSGNGSGTSMSHIKDGLSGSDSESSVSSGNADRQSEHTNNDINKHVAHLYGNIGVTQSTEMLGSFVSFYKDFNLYEQIAGLFVDEFCIRIY